MYKKLQNSIIKIEDNSDIPLDVNNIDYKEYLEWIDMGNTPQSKSLSEVQADKILEIESAYQSAITANIDYMSYTFQSDIPTHDNIKSVLSCGSVPDGFAWFDINNNPIPMTYSDLQGLSKVLVFRGFAAFAKKQVLKSQVRTAIDTITIQAIVW